MSLPVSPCPVLRLEAALAFPIVLSIRLELSLGENVAQQRQGSWGLVAQPQPRASCRPPAARSTCLGEEKALSLHPLAPARLGGPGPRPYT